MIRLFDTFALLAAEAGGGQPGGGAPGPGQGNLVDVLWSLAPFIAILAIFFWMMSRSQKKRDRKRQDILSAIRPKDDVMTVGGIHGRVVQVKEDSFVLRIDPEKDIKITIAKSGVSRKVGEPEPE